MLERNLLDQLKALSTDLFGASSRWVKLQQYKKVVSHTRIETVPGDNGAPDTEQEVQVPTLVNGMQQFTNEHRTPEEVLDLMTRMKAQRDAYIAMQRKIQEDALAKRAADERQKKLSEHLTGSAL